MSIETKLKFILVKIFFLLEICSTAFAGQIIYVDDDANGVNDGTSWENAYIYLQDALIDANSAEKPVEIRVAQGIYKPDRGAGITPSDKEATFQIINNVTLKGGYAGVGEPDPNIRNNELYKTILNGDLADNDVPIVNPHRANEDPSRTDNSLRIVTAININSGTEINGFIITGAFCYYPEIPDYICAGLYIERSSKITVSYCTFSYNAACGIVCNWSGPNIIDCTFENNVGDWRGGGVNIDYTSNPRIIRCAFKNNWGLNGGGLFCLQSKLWLEDCIFSRNVACGLDCADVGGGGGVFIRGSLAGSKIKNCVFNENVASSGGAMRIGIGLFPPPPSPRNEERVVISGCTFINNQASSDGAISQALSNLDIKSCTFLNNSAVYTGGAIGALSSITSFTNCIFSGNSAYLRGASIRTIGHREVTIHNHKYPQNFELALNNCTFKSNISPMGRALDCISHDSKEFDKAAIVNCIIDNSDNEIYNPDGSEMTISYTNLRGGIDTIYDPCEVLIWGEGNIDVDPLFANPGYWADANDPNVVVEPSDLLQGVPDGTNAVWIDGDYHLKSQAGRWDPVSGSWVVDDVTSPCIDAGDPNSSVGDEPEPNGGRINMGAYGGTEQASMSLSTGN
jgi:parallel beta-helix repeat protein